MRASCVQYRAANTPLQRGMEIGCGSGVARRMLEKDLGIPVDGCDLSRAGLEMAEPGRGRLLFYNILDLEPSLLSHYDALFLLDVVEHIPDDEAFLAAALQHLRPGGIVVVNVPASMMLFSQYDRVTGHVRRYTRSSLARLFRACGVRAGGFASLGSVDGARVTCPQGLSPKGFARGDNACWFFATESRYPGRIQRAKEHRDRAPFRNALRDIPARLGPASHCAECIRRAPSPSGSCRPVRFSWRLSI